MNGAGTATPDAGPGHGTTVCPAAAVSTYNKLAGRALIQKGEPTGEEDEDMTTAQIKARLLAGPYEGFSLRIGDVVLHVLPVAGQSLARPDVEIQLDIYMDDEEGTQRCALTERVVGAQQLRAALAQWREILT